MFYFVGRCSDCTGNGNGTLVVQNYTLGANFTPQNFVSLSYSSNLLSFAFTAPVNIFQGSLPVNLPAPAAVQIEQFGFRFLRSLSGGSWDAGFSNVGDFGPTSFWTTSAPPPPGIPAPPSLILVVTGLTSVGLYEWRRKLARFR